LSPSVLPPSLQTKGFDTNTISELTGINPVDQNTWLVGSTVYESIEATGKVRLNDGERQERVGWPRRERQAGSGVVAQRRPGWCRVVTPPPSV
jgi:hypothetical protein